MINNISEHNLLDIAQRNFSVETLETRNSDRLDLQIKHYELKRKLGLELNDDF